MFQDTPLNLSDAVAEDPLRAGGPIPAPPTVLHEQQTGIDQARPTRSDAAGLRRSGCWRAAGITRYHRQSSERDG